MIRHLLLALLLGLVACKNQPAPAETIVADVKLDTPTTESIPTLTEPFIDNTGDDDLVYLVLNSLDLPEDPAKDLLTANGRGKSQRAVYLVALVEAEVDNGGFNQFYYNQRQLTFKHLPEAFKLVGANRYAALVQKANETYQKHYKEITKTQDGSVEGFSKSYENNPLGKLDDVFYDLAGTENLTTLLAKYIREHKADFVPQP